MTDASCDRVIALIATRTGLNISERDHGAVRNVIQQRVSQLKLPSVDAYYQLLQTTSCNLSSHPGTGKSQQYSEWQQLLMQLTVGESYFFRDQKQLSLIKNQLLPDIIQQHLSQNIDHPQHLRIWSAGCATGEEVYSLAIIIRELGLPNERLRVEVLGTDINPEFLAKAQKGTYVEWSFRQTSSTFRQKYFQSNKANYWQVSPALKHHVTFQPFNLIQDDIGQLTPTGVGFDLIVCRNVFIYFTPTAIAQTLSTFFKVLKPGGYLVTGHAELQRTPLREFQVRCFPDSIVYQRPLRSRQSAAGMPTLQQTDPMPQQQLLGNNSPTSTSSFASNPSSLRPESTTKPLSLRSRTVSQRGTTTTTSNLPSWNKSVSHPSPSPAPNNDRAQTTGSFRQIMVAAKQYANVGRYQDARHACERAIALQPFSTEPCYLLANIAEETGDLKEAKAFIKRVIYLDDMAVPAYLELASLHERT
ncbi:MAG: CheR family methyltransferase [Leptolyngbyaceae cyanobacterium]